MPRAPASPPDPDTREGRIVALMEQLRPQVEEALPKLVECAVGVPEHDEFAASEFKLRDRAHA